jgi:steroid delta-isomerase-like uncharacterized protein
MDQDKAVVRRVFEDMFNRKDAAVADQIYTEDHAYHDPSAPGLPKGPGGVKAVLGAFVVAFPDLHMTVEDVIADGNKAVVRWVSRGTNTGSLMGLPATGKQVEVSGTTVYRLSGGKIAESWALWDHMGMMQQMGIIPTPGN